MRSRWRCRGRRGRDGGRSEERDEEGKGSLTNEEKAGGIFGRDLAVEGGEEWGADIWRCVDGIYME